MWCVSVTRKLEGSEHSVRAMVNMLKAPLFIAFGPLDWLDMNNKRHKVSGQELFHQLVSRRVWFCPRSVRASKGTPALFYLKGVGVLARADIDEVTAVQAEDLPLLSQYALQYLRTKLGLQNIEMYEPPIDIRPLIPELAFIKNKGRHWGTALRPSPRYISPADFDRIASAASEFTST